MTAKVKGFNRVDLNLRCRVEKAAVTLTGSGGGQDVYVGSAEVRFLVGGAQVTIDSTDATEIERVAKDLNLSGMAAVESVEDVLAILALEVLQKERPYLFATQE